MHFDHFEVAPQTRERLSLGTESAWPYSPRKPYESPCDSRDHGKPIPRCEITKEANLRWRQTDHVRAAVIRRLVLRPCVVEKRHGVSRCGECKNAKNSGGNTQETQARNQRIDSLLVPYEPDACEEQPLKCHQPRNSAVDEFVLVFNHPAYCVSVVGAHVL